MCKMESSTHPSMDKKEFPFGECSAVSGESGWTEYFEEFMGSERRKETSGCSSCSAGDGSSSTVSDAASCVLSWKLKNHVEESECFKELKSKRKKIMDFCLENDDPLDDTATSPASNTMISDLGNFDGNLKKEVESRGNSQVQGVASGDEDIVRRDEMNKLGGGLNQCIELKKRGLSLIPLSMLVNYLE